MKSNVKTILLIAFDCHPDVGSEAMVAYSWAKILQKYFDVHIITDIKNKYDLEKDGCLKNIHYCIYISEKIRTILSKLRVYNVLYKLFITKVKSSLKYEFLKDIDILHCLTPAGHYAYNNLYKLGRPVIAGPIGGMALPQNFREYETPEYKLRKLYYWLIKRNPSWIRYYENCSNILIGTSFYLKDLPLSTHSRTIEFFDTVVDTSMFKPGTEKEKNSEKAAIVYSGRLDATKGCLLLIEAVYLLVKECNRNINLFMLGDGPEEKHINDFIQRNALEQNIHLKGRVSINEVSTYLKKADIFCLPCLKESGGTSILEAMAAGLPVITTDYGGPSVSVTEECGIKIKPSNPEQYIIDLKAALLQLIDDKELRKSMGRNARERVLKEFSYNSLDKKIKNLYDTLLHEKQNSIA